MTVKIEINELLKIINQEEYLKVRESNDDNLKKIQRIAPLRKEIENYFSSLEEYQIDKLITCYLIGKDISKGLSSPEEYFKRNISKDILFNNLLNNVNSGVEFKDKEEKILFFKNNYSNATNYLETYKKYYS
ncbi:hypothetical protein P3U41_14885 [Mammaliicoccus sciuri]|uniref:hypothetical protein n=1 Tax=Mammaliicoccus sciuri TaxID=1296 RepID=UPI0018C94346|nr:hypothetical protein [Mammaliicoccus sciuri]MBG9211267.1 hypothetical protein [Mammaliicoccus sciuri]MDT0755444.1 hypothetical protein [Mammaliicoccus sciuri]WQL33180.1 hypothetical protein P3U41_14885 [Mammaliicoccus sciuri]WQL60118.1 hypothetical protein P3T96_14885 [Mammaliicoccus sciuri]